MLVLFAAIAAACLLATPAAAEDRPWPRRVSELRFLLKTERFAELDETIGLAQRRFERGETTEDEPWAMLQAFFENDSGTERWLKAWSDKRPVSYLALAARGLYYEGTGWSVRGKEWVQETASGQIRRMSEMHAVAESDCEKALSGAPSLVACHVALINIAKATGDQTLATQRYHAARRTLPESVLIATAYLESHTPRWGGSYAAMGRVLHDMSKQAVGRTVGGRALLGHVLADQAWTAAIDGDSMKAIELYTRAIAEGGGTAAYFAGRGVNAYRLDRSTDALKDFDRALEISPRGWPYSEAKLPVVLGSRARLKHASHLQEEAEADIRDALLLSPRSAFFRKLSREIASATRAP